MLAFTLVAAIFALPAGATEPAGSASTQVQTDTSSATEIQLMATQLYTDDDLTDRHLIYSELRGLLDSNKLFGVRALELHLDGRLRKGWNDGTADLYEVTRAYVQYGNENSTARFALGRLAIPSVASARVDGASLAFRLGSALSAGAFGGLTPHPISGAIDPRFIIGGAGYEYRAPTVNHAGGAALQLFDGALDRIYLSERGYLSFGSEWLFYGMAVVDLIPPQGSIDLSNAYVLARYRPAPVIDFNLSASHFHSIIPNKWYQDWIAEQRAARGFVIDGPDPVGTRRSMVRLVTNLHASNAFTPYLSLRYDRRHQQLANGYELAAGVKLTSEAGSYGDISVIERRFFESDGQLLTAQAGTLLAEVIALDAQATAMRTRPLAGGEAIFLYDLGASAGVELSGLSTALSGVRVMALYQAFIEPDIYYHAMFLQLGYRFRG